MNEGITFEFGPFRDIAEKIEAGERLSFEDGVRLSARLVIGTEAQGAKKAAESGKRKRARRTPGSD